MKKARQDMITAIIEREDVTTQEQLKALLEAEGFSVTQATLSRDINELRLKKESFSGGYRYVKPRLTADCPLIFREAVLEIPHAVNIVVIKCKAGMAQAVCSLLDKMKIPEIVGTISGDDTVFAVTESEKDAAFAAQELNEMIFG